MKAACRGRAAVHRHQGATFPPSIHPSLHHSSFLVSSFFLLLRSSYLFISPYFFISNSVLLLSFCAMEEATALARHSGHKERATEIKRRDATTHKILAYPRGIPTKLIPNEPNPSFSPSSLLISPTSFLFLLSLPDLFRGVMVSYSLICVNPCFCQHVESHQRARVAA